MALLLGNRMAHMSLQPRACPAVAVRPFAGTQLSCRQRAAPQVCCACRSPLVVEAKQKTRKAAAKRFRVKADGTLMRRHAGKQHINEKKSSKRKKFLSEDAPVHETCINNLMGCLPHAKLFIPMSRFTPGEQIRRGVFPAAAAAASAEPAASPAEAEPSQAAAAQLEPASES